MALLLTVDTATPAGSVAVSRGETLLGEELLNIPRTHTDRLLPAIDALLDRVGVSLTELDGFGVVLGPGAFTGLRVGVATVKGLALGTGKPVVGVSSLQTLAVQAPLAGIPLHVWLDARKGQVYAGRFDWQGGRPQPTAAECVADPDALLAQIPDSALFIGDGALAYRTLITRQLGGRAHFVPWALHTPRAASAAVLALDALQQGATIPLEQLTPRYIRPSEAELLWARRQAEGTIDS